jgi:hypothetical protein
MLDRAALSALKGQREGEQLGPFESKAKVESKLRDYLATQLTIHRLRQRDPLLVEDERNNAKQIGQLSRELQKLHES